MTAIPLLKIWVKINNVLTSINLTIVYIFFSLPIFSKKQQPLRIPLAANIALLAFLIFILALLIKSSTGGMQSNAITFF